RREGLGCLTPVQRRCWVTVRGARRPPRCRRTVARRQSLAWTGPSSEPALRPARASPSSGRAARTVLDPASSRLAWLPRPIQLMLVTPCAKANERAARLLGRRPCPIGQPQVQPRSCAGSGVAGEPLIGPAAVEVAARCSGRRL